MRQIGILLMVSIAATCTVATATVRRVPSEYPTIQAGIDAAVDGDTVLVADGTYTKGGNRDIDFKGKAILVTSESGPEVTVINCEGREYDPHRGFYFHSGEDVSSVVQGFTITNGLVILYPPLSYGGAILCDSTSSPTIEGNTITGNISFYYPGGGISCRNNSSPTIESNAIIGNTAYSGNGGGIFCDYSSPTIVGNTIAGNRADWGGGIFCYSSSPTITGNTITGNTAYEYDGSGIYCAFYSSPTVLNCILWADNAGTGQEISVTETCSIDVSYSDIQGGWEGEGNIDAGPLFVTGPLGDYYLSQIAASDSLQSPCVDAGDPDSPVPEGTTRRDEVLDALPADMGYHYPCGGGGVNEGNHRQFYLQSHYLAQNYPNPFCSNTTITYSLASPTVITLSIYDICGALVRTLFSGTASGGQHSMMWNGTDHRGRRVSSGIYFCRLTAGVHRETKRMVVLR